MFGFKTLNSVADLVQDGVAYGRNEVRSSLNIQPYAKFKELCESGYSTKIATDVVNKTFSTSYKQADLKSACKQS